MQQRRVNADDCRSVPNGCHAAHCQRTRLADRLTPAAALCEPLQPTRLHTQALDSALIPFLFNTLSASLSRISSLHLLVLAGLDNDAVAADAPGAADCRATSTRKNNLRKNSRKFSVLLAPSPAFIFLSLHGLQCFLEQRCLQRDCHHDL